MNLTHIFVKKVFDSVAFRDATFEDCALARLAHTNSPILTARVVHLVLCLIGAFSAVLFVFVLSNSKASSLHVNLRLSLVSLSLGALLACSQLFYIAFQSLMQAFTATEPCEYLVDVAHCALIRFPVILAIYATLLGMATIAVERLIATIKYRTYEVKGSWLVGTVLIIVQWAIAIVLALVSTTIRSDHGLLHYCTAYISHPSSSIVSLSLMTFFELSMLVFYFALLQVNRHKQVNEFVNNALHSLTERYQLQENVRLMLALIPSVGVHAALSLIGLAAMIGFALLHGELDGKALCKFAPFSEFIMLLLPIYAIALPTASIARNKQLRVAARRTLPCLWNSKNERIVSQLAPPLLRAPMSARPSRQVEEDGDTHFDILAEMWTK